MSVPVAFTSAGAAAGPQAFGGGAPSNLQKARLLVHRPPASGGTAKPGELMFEIVFQFNPKELALTKNARWRRDEQPNARRSAPPQFQGSEPAKLSLEMFLDATERMDDSVVRKVELLFGCCVATEETRQGGNGSPPWVIFKWGGLTGFTAYVASVSAKYTLFTPAGTPVRAVCTVNLEEISGEQPGQNPTSGALAARTAHVTVAGDTLAGIAFRTYGDPGRWRVIAEANRIDNPLRLPTGLRLLLPAPEEIEERRARQ